MGHYIYADVGSYEPLARLDGKPGCEEFFYFHTNLAGLPEQLTDAEGGTVWHSEYQTWGKSREEWRSAQQTREQNLRFQGQYLDREKGLHYNTFRFFDPEVGRFTQADPIGLAGGVNFYSYGPNPMEWIDPLGLSAVNPKTILYSQDDINHIFEDGRNVNELKHRLKNDPSYAHQIEPIRKVRMHHLPDDLQVKLKSQGAHKDSVFSLDNRRLYAAKEAGISKIPSRWATPAELASIRLERRFTKKNGGKSIKSRGCP